MGKSTFTQTIKYTMNKQFFKTSVIAAAFTFGAFGSTQLFAQETPAETETVLAINTEDKVEISEEELPEAVSTGFQNSAFAEQDVRKIYHVSTEEGVSSYEFHLGEEGMELVVLFNEEGEVVEE